MGGINEIFKEYEIKECIIEKFKEVFKNYGYRMSWTSTFEYYDLFSSKNGAIKNEEMFKFIDKDGEILVLRPDVTTQIAKMVANNYKNYEGYLKLSHISQVFRMNPKENGKEFTQGGVECFGNSHPSCDAEIIAMAIEIFIKNSLYDFKMDIGQSNFYKGLLEEANMKKEEEEMIKKMVEDKNIPEMECFLNRINMDAKIKNVFFKIPTLYGNIEEILNKAERICLNEKMKNSLKNLNKVYEILSDYGYGKYIFVDLGLVNHLDYYTGVIFKGYITGYNEILLSGGRYDQLTKEYGNLIPATGFGVNIDKVVYAMKRIQKNSKLRVYKDYLIVYKEEDRKEAFQMAKDMREKGFSVETDLYKDLKNHIHYAETNSIKDILMVNQESLKLIQVIKNIVSNIRKDLFMKSLEEVYEMSIH